MDFLCNHYERFKQWMWPAPDPVHEPLLDPREVIQDPPPTLKQLTNNNLEKVIYYYKPKLP